MTSLLFGLKCAWTVNSSFCLASVASADDAVMSSKYRSDDCRRYDLVDLVDFSSSCDVSKLSKLDVVRVDCVRLDPRSSTVRV